MAQKPKPSSPDEKLFHVLRHPLRSDLLRRYLEAERSLSPKELAAATKQPLSTVSYHVRELARFGTIEVVEEKKGRGSVAHFYEATPLVDEVPWAREALGMGGGRR